MGSLLSCGTSEVVVELGALADMGVGLVFAGLAAAVGFVVAIGAVVLLLQGRRVPPALAATGIGLAAAGGTITGALEGLSWDPGNVEVMRIVALTTAGARLLAFFALLPIAATFLVGAAVAAARHAPRRPILGALGLALTTATAAIVVAGGVATGDSAFANLRGLAYAALGALVAVGWIGGDRDGANGPEVRALTAVCFPLIVAAGEGARQGLIECVMLVRGFEGIAPELRAATVAAYYDAVAGEWAWRWAAVAAASAVGVAGVVASWRQRPSVGVGAALAWLLVAALICGVGDVGAARMVALATSAP